MSEQKPEDGMKLPDKIGAALLAFYLLGVVSGFVASLGFWDRGAPEPQIAATSVHGTKPITDRFEGGSE